jgi:hypothetical protein
MGVSHRKDSLESRLTRCDTKAFWQHCNWGIGRYSPRGF